jgi:hypothetical protein
MFHCPNLQGVLLGIGLFMLERLYAEQNTPSAPPEPSGDTSRNPKRRKTTNSPSPEADDYEYFTAVGAGGKKKGGIGYAGLPTEDVCVSVAFISLHKNLLPLHV